MFPEINNCATNPTVFLNDSLLKVKPEISRNNVESEIPENLTVRLAKCVLYMKVSPVAYHSSQIKWKSEAERETSQALLEIVNKLLAVNGSHFNKLLTKLDYNENNIAVAFARIANEVLHGDSKDISWSRIGILFAFATTMAKSCLQNPSQQVLDDLSVRIGAVIEENAGDWIKRQGGWTSLKVEPKESTTGILMGMLCVGTTVLGAAFTIFGYGQTTSAFTSMLKK